MTQQDAPSRTLPDARRDEPQPHSLRAALGVAFVGYASMVVVLLGIGYLLTHTLDGSVGGWDQHVNEWFARHRTSAWNDVTKVATMALNTVPVVVMASLAAGFLALRRRFREAAFLVVALVIEITVFLSVTFVVDRPRPDVPRMNSTPSTSSFPSGHTAAATVLFVGVALIIAISTRHRVLKVLAGVASGAITVLVGFARVYRGLHHPTDVFVGALFGLGCLAVAALAVRTFTEKRTPGDDAPDARSTTEPLAASGAAGAREASLRTSA